MPWPENLQRRLNAAARLPLGTKAIFAALAFGCIAAVALAFLWPGFGLSESQMAKMDSGELTTYVFDHQGCKSCHTLNANYQLGFTVRGIELSSGFEGCASLLTEMAVVAQVQPDDRTPEEKGKAAKFEEFGCNTCHQTMPGKAALTSYGTKLKSLHFPGCALPSCCSRPQR